MNPSNMIRVVTATLCVAGAVSSAVAAQQVPHVRVGKTVRLWAPSLQLTETGATVLAWTDSTLKLRRLRAPFDSIAVPIGSVTRLERLDGKHPASTVLGVLAGATLGTLVGVAGSKNPDRAPCESFSCWGEGFEEGFTSVMVGLLLGGGLGGLIGNAVAPDRWEEVPLDRVRPKVIAQRNGFGLALTVRF